MKCLPHWYINTFPSTLTSCEDASQTCILYPAQERKTKYAPCGFGQTFFKSLMHGSSPCGAMGIDSQWQSRQ